MMQWHTTSRRRPWWRRLFSLLPVLLLGAGACETNPAQPAAPQTVEAARKAFDEAIVRVAWAQLDLWKLGCRDVQVAVQLDSSMAPQYFRLPRGGC